MPIYAYKCVNCEHEFEQRQRMKDLPLEECPVCEGPVRRVVKSVGIVFKGSGFYVTDNRNGNSATSGSGGSKGVSEKKEKEESKPVADAAKNGATAEKKVTEATN